MVKEDLHDDGQLFVYRELLPLEGKRARFERTVLRCYLQDALSEENGIC